jgi:hypothetical protein
MATLFFSALAPSPESVFPNALSTFLLSVGVVFLRSASSRNFPALKLRNHLVLVGFSKCCGQADGGQLQDYSQCKKQRKVIFISQFYCFASTYQSTYNENN